MIGMSNQSGHVLYAWIWYICVQMRTDGVHDAGTRSILLENSIHSRFLSSWLKVSVQHLIIINCLKFFIMTDIWTFQLIGVYSILDCSSSLCNSRCWIIHVFYGPQISVFRVFASLKTWIKRNIYQTEQYDERKKNHTIWFPWKI